MTIDDRSLTMDRLREGWAPTHSPAAEAYLARFREEAAGRSIDAARFVPEPSGLDHRDIHTIINDRTLGERFFEIHADFLHPADSLYIDPIYGAFRGQRAIRAWLIPALAGAGAVSFDAVHPAEFLDDGEGGLSIDEWHLTVHDGVGWIPVTAGVSIRRYREGWITDAIDYFDTTPVRAGAAQVAEGSQAIELPPPPVDSRRSDRSWAVAGELSDDGRRWLAARAEAIGAGSWPGVVTETGLSNHDLTCLLFDRRTGRDFSLVCDLMHPTEARYHDPVFGVIEGQEAIRAWLTDIMGKAGTIEFEPLSPTVLDRDVAFQEYQQVAVLPDGTRQVMLSGASVRRFRDGFVVHAADYFDTAHFFRPEVAAASLAAGATLTAEDVLRYRPDLVVPDQSTQVD